MSNSDHGGRRGGIELVLTRTCTACSAAFEADLVRCPSCRRLRPRSGWEPSETCADPWLGRKLDGRYVLTRRIGRGAAASVYEARTPYTDERCAAKVIDLSVDPFREDVDQWSAQVRNEVEILARVRSPHVVNFYDVVEIPGPAIVIVTEYIDGETLGDLLDRSGALEVHRALELCRQVAVGMAEVHRRGAVHRDLKPDNILLQRFHGREDFVHVIDFGIVQSGEDTLRDSGYLGTPLYSSPEQSRGRRIGPESDIYSLGAVLFHLLAGIPPFEGRTPEALLSQHAFTRAPSIAESGGDGDFEPDVVDLVAAMLEKKPPDRPGSMAIVAERLSRLTWAADETVPGGSVSSAVTEFTPPDTGEHRALPGVSDASEASDQAPPEANPDGWTLEAPMAVAGDGGAVRLGADNAVLFRPHWRNAEAERAIWKPGVAVGALTLTGGIVTTGHVDGSVSRFDVASGGVDALYRNPGLAPITAIDATASGTLAAVGSSTGHTWLGDLATPDGDGRHIEPGRPVTAIAIDADRSAVAVGRANRSIDVYTEAHDCWDPERRLEADAVPASLVFSQDGFLLAVWSTDFELEIFNLSNGSRVDRRAACRFQAAFAFLDPSGSICLPACRVGAGPTRCARLE